MIKLKDLIQLDEGVNDPGILKAIFLAGGPGSGKTFIAQGLFGIPEKINVSAQGLKLVNQDTELEYFLKKFGFGTDLDDMPPEVFRQLTDPDYEDYSGLRGHAKALSKERLRLYSQGRLGVIIDGTGHKSGKIAKQKKKLEDLGYDCYMVFVHTDLDVALERNLDRPRKVPEEIVKHSWNEVQSNKAKFKKMFGKNFLKVTNNKRKSGKKAIMNMFNSLVSRGVDSFMKKPVKNPIGKDWIKKQQILKKR